MSITRKFTKMGRQFRRRARAYWPIAAFALVIIVSLAVQPKPEEHLDYSNLLSTIAKGESRGNYNAYYGHADNRKLRLTEMTIGEVLTWQKAYVEQGSPSSAAGKYQIIRPTLEGLVRELKIDKNELYDEPMQDRLAIALLERRGVRDYARGKISREQFAHNLSQEWAALPKILGDKPDESYYAGDGLNKVQISRLEILSSIETLKR